MPAFPCPIEAAPTLLTSSPVSCATLAGLVEGKTVDTVVPATLAEVTPAFLVGALRSAGALPPGVTVSEIAVQPTEVSGFLSSTGRAAITYARAPTASVAVGPPSVIVKMQAESETSRQVALGADNYEMERRVYERLASEMAVGTARCLQITRDARTGNVVFVMEDLSVLPGAYSIDQWRPGGCSADEALAVARALGGLHAQYWQWSGALPAWLPRTDQIEARDAVGLAASCGDAFRSSYHYEVLGQHAREAVELALARARDLELALRAGPQTLLHHDARADNLFWGKAGVPAGVVFLDWQMVGQGVGALDLAWFSASSFLEPGEPLRWEENRRLCVAYWRSLVEGGVDAVRYPLEAAWRDYTLGFLWGFLVVTQLTKFGEPSEVVKAFCARVTHAMVELDAHKVPCQRLVVEPRVDA